MNRLIGKYKPPLPRIGHRYVGKKGVAIVEVVSLHDFTDAQNDANWTIQFKWIAVAPEFTISETNRFRVGLGCTISLFHFMSLFVHE